MVLVRPTARMRGFMPKGPRGESRPPDIVGCAILVGRIAVGDVTEEPQVPSGRVRSGLAGAKARSDSLTAQQRSDVARKAANARWS